MYALNALKKLVSTINSYAMNNDVWRKRAEQAYMTKPRLAEWMVDNKVLETLLRSVRRM
jgi:hypothetical protein